MLGTECVRGVNERCQATQYATNPVQYQIGPPFVKTNDAGWYLDQGLMVALASNIMSLVPYYVGSNSVCDGTNNIVMLTFTGLLASLHLGDGTNFTATPCWTNNVGQTNCTTNAATFGPWAWRNYVVAWQERYKVVSMLSKTIATPLVTGLTMYHGEGKGKTWEDAYGAAVSSCVATPVTNGHPFDQHCKGILWSNYYSHFVEDAYDYDTWDHGKRTNEHTKFHVTVSGNEFVSGTNIRVVSVSNFPMYQTNLIVTGGANVLISTNVYTNIVVESGVGITNFATGGTITTNGKYIIHTFTNDGSFVVSDGSLNCEVLVVAGGGGGGNGFGGGGGGAGGLIYTNVSVSGSNTVVVGAGGLGNQTANNHGFQGSNSVFGGLTAYGGGWGVHYLSGGNGGSGGGASGPDWGVGGVAINGQGNNGGAAYSANPWGGGGGGGAGSVGANGTAESGGNGGDGLAFDISGTLKYYAGGGGAGADSGPCGTGGSGVGGNGAIYSGNATDGAVNTGSGGGGGSWGYIGAGGSGIVIVRYSRYILSYGDRSGVYVEGNEHNGNRMWESTNGFSIFNTNSSWVIFDSLILDTNAAYLESSSPIGEYEAVNFDPGATSTFAEYAYSNQIVGVVGSNGPAGTYVPNGDVVGYPAWICTNNGYVAEVGEGDRYYIWKDIDGVVSSWSNTDGTLSVTTNYSPVDVNTATGNLSVVTTNALVFDKLESSGLYEFAGETNGDRMWHGSAGYIYYLDGLWIICADPALGTNQAYLFKDTEPVGEYTATNFYTGSTTSGYEYVYTHSTNDPDGVYWEVDIDGLRWPGYGNYVWDGPVDDVGMWHLVCEDSMLYLSRGTVSTTSNVWIGIGEDPEFAEWGEGIGDGYYGVPDFDRTTWNTTNDIFATNTWGTNTVFYECWLTKVSWTNNVFASTGVEHQVSHYVYPAKTSIATSNVWDAEATGWSSNVWNEATISGWNNAQFSDALLGGDVSEVPVDCGEPTVPNVSRATGLRVLDKLGAIGWYFLYCTNLFW